MIPTIDMSECTNAEIQHETNAEETTRKWRVFCKKRREKENGSIMNDEERGIICALCSEHVDPREECKTPRGHFMHCSECPYWVE